MKKFLQIMLHEYQRNVFRWRFLFALLSLPLFACLLSIIMLISFLPELNFKPVGYIDGAGILKDQAPAEQTLRSPLIPRYLPFLDEAQARQALDAGEIQAYFVLADDYRVTGKALLVVSKRLSMFVRLGFSSLLQQRLLEGQPEAVIHRLQSPGSISVISAYDDVNIGPHNWLNFLAPLIASFFLTMIIFNTAGLMMNVIVEERENRTLEVLLTSSSPFQLIGGKTCGLIGVGLTQLLIWFIPLALMALSSYNLLQGLQLDRRLLDTLLLIGASIIPVFFTYGAFLSAIGAAAPDSSQAQMFSSLLNLPFMIPVLLFFVLYSNPNSSLAIALSLIPPTAPMTLGIRSIAGPLPPEQIALSMGVLSITALLSIWLSGYVWKAGWQYSNGLRLRWRPFRRKPGRALPAAQDDPGLAPTQELEDGR